jgi:hypothetical protein
MAREGMDTATGEVVPLPVKYDPREYLASLSKQDGLTIQKQLAAAYDAACAALIGPNDVQKAEGREFKKKSAWRKLARYFNISVEIVKVEREMLNDTFLATVTARAVAPWGQSYEEVGACGTDEATGRRTISVADAIATASTRASNRAVSNLIAMGEVSAEEIGDRQPHGSAPRTERVKGPAPLPKAASDAAGDFVMPFGKTKGTPLGQMDPNDLKGARDWARDKGKFPEFVAAADAVLAGLASEVQEMEEEFPEEIPF